MLININFPLYYIDKVNVFVRHIKDGNLKTYGYSIYHMSYSITDVTVYQWDNNEYFRWKHNMPQVCPMITEQVWNSIYD